MNEYSFYIDINKEENELTVDDIINCWPLNQKFFGELVRAMNNKNLVPLIGAGVTRNTSKDGFPNWKSLLIKIAEDVKLGESEIKRIKDSINAECKFEEAAQILEDICGKNIIQETLRDVFSSSNLDDDKIKDSALMSLLNLYPKIILTTNYDCAIEKAYDLRKNDEDCNERIREGIKVLTPGSNTRNFVKAINESSSDNSSKTILYKFHGDVNDNGETHDLILSKSAYDKYYGNNGKATGSLTCKDLVRNLQIFLFSKTILFIGCSLDKDRIIDLISKNTDVDHYAFVGCGSNDRNKFNIGEANKDALKRSKELNKLNIHPIFYPRYARVAVKKLLENLSNKNTSIYASSLHPKKYIWMKTYFNQMLNNNEKIEKHILIFGGIGRDLREKSEIITLLEKLLIKNKNAKLYFCYDSDNAALHRNKQVKAEIQRKGTVEKIEEIKRIPKLFDIKNKEDRIVIVPIKYDLTGYAIIIDDKLFWNIITEQRSSDSPIIQLNIKEGENINFINYIKYALEQTYNIIKCENEEMKKGENNLIVDENIKILERNSRDIESVLEIMNGYLNENNK